ncbi:hypothetical protein [Antarcticimicrobium luteum]|uniref:hypothetical protein n=1 Tax=Antarcticimicrobium luteum TaxID=2547397 RepID=UPI00197CE70E|nr:hypothetical protein [Antarcticimicrobium luteum]
MTAAFALPFLSLPDESVTLGHWMIGQTGDPLLPMKPILDEWDYAADVELRGSVSIDMRAAAKILAIPEEELKLAVVLKIGTGRGRFPRIVERVSSRLVDAATDQPVELHVIVPGNTLSGRLHARIDVLLAAPAENASILSPTRTGSRLWSHEFSVELEDGGDNRFPMEVVSFTETFPSHRHVTAPWYLSWRPGGLTGVHGRVVFFGEAILEPPQEGTQTQRAHLRRLLLDRKAGLHARVRLAACRGEPFPEAARTRKEVDDAEIATHSFHLSRRTF